MPTNWQALRVRAGTVARAEPHPRSRHPAQLQSSARLTDLYRVDDLVDRQVVGAHDGAVVLLGPDRPVEPGSVVA